MSCTAIALASSAWLLATPMAASPTWDMTQAELESVGLGQSRGEPLLPPADLLVDDDAWGQSAAQAQAFGQHTMFVNFDGAVLNDAGEDSRTNSTAIGFSGAFEAYGDGAKRSAVLQAVQADWLPYNIAVTDARPAEGDYVMTMVGPTNFTGSLGVALLDCNNSWTQNNIVYAFHNIGDHYSAAGTATTISQEVAHSYGLEHVDEPADIMNPVNAGGDSAFLDQCFTLVPASFGIACVDQHAAQCGNEEHQNGHAELLDLIGTSEPDTVPPTVDIITPADGATFTEGESFRIEVGVTDDRGIARLTLYSDDTVVGTDDADPWGWDVAEVPAGTYSFVAEALDAGGNMTRSTPISVIVDPAPEGGDDTDGADDGDSDGGDDDANPDDGQDTDADPDSDDGGTADDGDPDGEPGGDAASADDRNAPRYLAFDPPSCDCRAPGHAPRSPGWACLLLLALLRRRRR